MVKWFNQSVLIFAINKDALLMFINSNEKLQ